MSPDDHSANDDVEPGLDASLFQPPDASFLKPLDEGDWDFEPLDAAFLERIEADLERFDPALWEPLGTAFLEQIENDKAALLEQLSEDGMLEDGAGPSPQLEQGQ